MEQQQLATAIEVVEEGVLGTGVDVLMDVDGDSFKGGEGCRKVGLLDDFGRLAGAGLELFREDFHGGNLVGDDEDVFRGKAGGERKDQGDENDGLHSGLLFLPYFNAVTSMR